MVDEAQSPLLAFEIGGARYAERVKRRFCGYRHHAQVL